MLDGAFSFQGRIGRLNFFLAGLVMIPAIVVVALVMAFLMAAAQRGAASLVFFIIVVALLAIVAGWYSLSLYVRRIRDIGWDPFVVIVGWFMIGCADIILAKLVPSMALGHNQAGTALGGIFNFALSMALFFWPGRDGNGDIAAVFDGPSGATSRLDALVGGAKASFAPPAPVAAAPIALPGAAPKGFGRRGAS